MRPRWRRWWRRVATAPPAAAACAEMRSAIGSAVFFGMPGVTVFGLFFTPVFYAAIRRLTGAQPNAKPATAE